MAALPDGTSMELNGDIMGIELNMEHEWEF